jgi:hypothetical protein
LRDFTELFSANLLAKPLILIFDEFDTLAPEVIELLANAFRNIYMERQQQSNQPTDEKNYLLHGLALIGVRAVLGIENVSGSPFNIQRSVHIPNLTYEEVEKMFAWYNRDSGQRVESAVVERLFYEMNGQPGLTCWMGELLTEKYNRHEEAIMPHDFEIAYAAAVDLLPNNNILNIISKAKDETHKPLLLELFRTNHKMPFRYDDPSINFLYLNGIVEPQVEQEIKYYLKFASPFVQKRLFNHFAFELFRSPGRLYDPFDDLSDTITDESLHVIPLMRRYEQYLQANRDWLFRDAPRRRTDEHLYEAVYHFNLYMYLMQFLQSYDSSVVPEFPTGNGQVDLLIHHADSIYALEIKSFVNQREYKNALAQAARYGRQLQLQEVALVFFVDQIDEANRRKFEVTHTDAKTGVVVEPVFVATG